MRPLTLVLLGLLAVSAARDAQAFCGFYVAKADAKIFNKASQVVLVREGDRTVLTMASDFKGEPKEFAVVVPVPTFLEKDQIHVGERAPVEHLDAYTSPRLVEYFDGDPCAPPMPMSAPAGAGGIALRKNACLLYTSDAADE